MRSWDSDNKISSGRMPSSRTGTRSSSRRIPIPPRAAISLVAQVSPAAPRSCTAITPPARSASSVASIRSLPANGSPICTEARSSRSDPVSSSSEANAAPPMPSRRCARRRASRHCRGPRRGTAPHSRGGAVEGIHRARMIVAFHLERDRPPAADVQYAGILAGTLQQAWALRGQQLERDFGVLVPAVFRPHHPEHLQLQLGWIPPQPPADFLVLVARQADGFWSQRGRRHLLWPLVIASPEGAWRSPLLRGAQPRGNLVQMRLLRRFAPRNNGGDRRFE